MSADADTVTRAGAGILVMLATVSLSRPALGQRVTPDFPRVSATSSVTPPAFGSAVVPFGDRARECRRPAALTVAFNGLGGAAAGWLAYELTVGILVAAEGAKPDATVRRVRTTLILSGAAMGVARGVYVVHACRAR